MFSIEDHIFLTITTAEFIIGMFVNGYIGLVIYIDWIKKKKISTTDYILSNLAHSRICLLCVMTLNGTILALYPGVYENEKIKIAGFFHRLFLWLKWRIKGVFHWSLLGSLAISMLISLIQATLTNSDYEFLKIENVKETSPNCSIHTRRMQLRAPGSRDPSTEAHVRAMKAVISFLLLFIAYYLAYLVATSSYFMPETELAVIVVIIVMSNQAKASIGSKVP
ncbi:hypothetical protein MG293_002621 [Ovis ammon polii]|uniref:Taste receptor type 2 member 8 n=1 Tax=Ovis ammon polii TaxID=230172 RepID=A0AAD4UHF4_OVIAM|nr:hypothetical protein MG293_002621 [Ovis ammon polii]